MLLHKQFVRRLPLVAFLLAAAPAAETAPEWPGLALPTPAELRAQRIPPHPRLILSRERIDEMRRQVSAGGRMQSWYAELETRGDRYGEEALPTYIVERTERYSRTLLSMSRRMLERTQTFALLYRLSGDKKYAERAWRELEAAAGFRDWNPAHFLDVGEMTHAFAIGYDWLYDYWTRSAAPG